MITIHKKEEYSFNGGDRIAPIYYVEMQCLSTDTKPTEGVITGSLAWEVDTGDIYAFDESSSTWIKQ